MKTKKVLLGIFAVILALTFTACGYDTVSSGCAHQWSEWEVIKEPNNSNEGERTRTCAKCSEDEVNIILAQTPGLLFTLINNNTAYSVSLGTATATEIIIPAVYNGLPVIEIENGGFYDSAMTSILIPNSVTSIGHEAFSGCVALTSITIPASVTSIGFAFQYTGLESVTVDSGNTVYRSEGNCIIEISNNTLIAGFKNSVIPLGVTSIGVGAFYACIGLTSITIPDSVTSIGDYAFSYCTDLTSITIPNGVTSIGGFAFNYCSGLTNITIPDSVTSIGGNAFSNCTGLTNITIPDSVTSIGIFAFAGCTGLTNITIPASVTSIGNSAFSRCTGLESITVDSGNAVYRSEENCIILRADNVLIHGFNNGVIPDSVTSIGDFAFFNFIGLTSITIPDSVISIGSYAFSYWPLTSITIPDSVTSIGSGAFAWTGLTSVTLGTIAETNFGTYIPFPGNLRDVYFADGGGAGTYTTTNPGDNATWTKQ